MKDLKTGKFIGGQKVQRICLQCNEYFESYKSENKKYCSKNCYSKSLLKYNGSKLGLSAKHRARIYKYLKLTLF